jgi:hypothetical protein
MPNQPFARATLPHLALAVVLAAAPAAGAAQIGSPSQCDAVAGNLVRNCGFEMDAGGSAPPVAPPVWVAANPIGGGAGVSLASNHVHSGEQAAYFWQRGGFGMPSGYGAIRQTLATVPGQTYAIALYAVVPNLYAPAPDVPEVAPNALRILFGGTTVFEQVLTNDAPQLFTATALATGARTDLAIEGVARVQFTAVDDVSVVAVVPEPSTFVLLAAGLLGVGSAAARCRRPTRV